ncbi:MAG: Rrf2 family transcriptional regulator [Ahrensia sp.]|nr:Rrf2 family transcriptional regulator [Ahrensia sp.]
MRLTNQTNYAIRMLMYCATKKEPATVGEIAQFYRLPQPFLFKITKVLVDAGFLCTQRGRNGGLRLASAADDIVLGDVVRATEASFDIAECFSDEDVSCPLVNTCGLNQTLHEALDAFMAVLDRTTIAELTRNQHNIRVLQQLHEARLEPLASA